MMDEFFISVRSALTDTFIEVSAARGTTTRQLLRLLEEKYAQEGVFKGVWGIEEDWNGCRRTLSSDEKVPTGGPVSLHLVQQSTHKSLQRHTQRKRKRKVSGAELVDWSSRHMESFLLASGHIPKSTQLCCAHWMLQRQLRRVRKKHSSIVLRRLADQQSVVWGPVDATPLNKLSAQLLSLQEDNLNNTNEVADLNIELTRLQQTLTPLQEKVEQLASQLTRIKDEVQLKKKEKNVMAATASDVDSLRAQLVHCLKELESKNQVGRSLSSKVTKLESHLKMQQSQLKDKKREISHLKILQTTSRHSSKKSHSLYQLSEQDVRKELSINKTATLPLDRGHAPFSTMTKKSSASLTRRGRSLMEKYRELVAEEGHTFRKEQHYEKNDQKQQQQQQQQQQQPHVDVGNSSWHNISEGTLSESTPAKISGILQLKTQNMGDENTSRSVRFLPEAIVLNAALEGDLDTMKECIARVGVGYRNEKGVTCLHNAVCSGNMEAVQYLVDILSCDINSQDIDGWTPLHCATAFDNLHLVKYLVEHGASLFLATIDGDTPVGVATKEQQEEDGDQETCAKYLNSMETEMGVANHGTVFALFSRGAEDDDELELKEGERLTVIDRCHGNNTEWWLVRNGRGHTGGVPHTYLGLYRRVNEVL